MRDKSDIFNTAFKKICSAHLRPMEPVPTGMKPGGRLERPVKCILFDVYGTLLISAAGDIGPARKSALASKAFQTILNTFRVSTPAEQVLESYFREIRAAHQRAKAKGVDYPEVHIDRIWARILETENMYRAKRFSLEFELMANPVFPMPHLELLLAACRQAGLIMGIISNAQFYTPLLFQWFLKGDPAALGFSRDLLLYSYEVGCAKPSPGLFKLAVGRLGKRGISPGSVLYIGNDEKKDILPAKQAGFQTALFAGDARSLRLGENRSRADLIITDLHQLPAHLSDCNQNT